MLICLLHKYAIMKTILTKKHYFYFYTNYQSNLQFFNNRSVYKERKNFIQFFHLFYFGVKMTDWLTNLLTKQSTKWNYVPQEKLKVPQLKKLLPGFCEIHSTSGSPLM